MATSTFKAVRKINLYKLKVEVSAGSARARAISLGASYAVRRRAGSVRPREAHKWLRADNGCSATCMCGVSWPYRVKYRGELVAAHHSRDTSRRDTTRTVRRLLRALGRLAGICLGKRMASIAPYRSPSEFCLSKNKVRVSFALGDPLSPRRATADRPSPYACGKRQESGEPSPYLEETSNN
jgi:hypothetical protein